MTIELQDGGGLLVLGCDPGAGARLVRDASSAFERIDLCDDLTGGYSAARELRPAVIVVGPEVPGDSAIDLARRLRDDPEVRLTYLIVVTDPRAPLDVVSALDAGANDLVRDPVDRRELAARIRSGIRCREMHLELQRDLHRDAILRMATTLGHEVSNPLTALFGHLELALRNLEDGSVDRMKHHLKVAGEIASRIGKVAQALTEMGEPGLESYLGPEGMLALRDDEVPARAD